MKKVWNVVKNIFTWAVVLIAVGMMIFTIISVNTFDRADRNLFGYKAFIPLYHAAFHKTGKCRAVNMKKPGDLGVACPFV